MSAVPESAADRSTQEVWRRAAGFVVNRIEEPWTPDGGPRTEICRTNALDVLDRLRSVVCEGHRIGGTLRALAHLEIVLHDHSGARLGSMALIGSDVISWGRERSGNDFEVSAYYDLWLLLSGLGVAGSLARLIDPLVLKLGLEEGAVQFRPALRESEINAVMSARRAPRSLWSWLADFSSKDAERIPLSEIDEQHAQLCTSVPDPVDRARVLLAWWGSLTWQAEAVAGDGMLAQMLLSRIGRQDVLRAMEGPAPDAALVFGAVIWANASGSEVGVAERIGSAIRMLLSPDPPTGLM